MYLVDHSLRNSQDKLGVCFPVPPVEVGLQVCRWYMLLTLA